jgi:hypothetical protein
VWIAAAAGAAVVAVTLTAVGAPASPYPGGQSFTIYDPVTENWGAVAPDLTPFGLPRALISTSVGVKAVRVKGKVPCRDTSGAIPAFTYLTETITAFLVCGPTSRGMHSTAHSVTISREYQQRDFRILLSAMTEPERFGHACAAILIVGPIVYAHTDSGWWLVREPIQGCDPNYPLLEHIRAANRGDD